MKKVLLILLATIIYTGANSQSLSQHVIASSGGYFASANTSLSWTLGETMTQTFTNGTNTLTQGFQQPNVSLALLNLKAYFEGFYTGVGKMDNSGAGGCLYINGISPNPLDVDTITVSAMNSVTHAVVDTKKGIIKTNGTASIVFGNAVIAGNSYYIRVQHRNTIETWSAAPVLMNSATSYDFTTAQSKAYGNNMIQTLDNLGWAFFSGDISDNNNLGLGLGFQDGIIEGQDYLDMENGVQALAVGYIPSDITGDGVCESSDYLIMENNVSAIRFSVRP